MAVFGEYLDYDAVGLAELVRTKQVHPRELVEAAVERIERFNPQLNAVVHKIYDRALTQADGPLADGPMAGVPFLLKDLIALYTGEPTTGSSRFLQFHVADHDTTMVRRYRAAGLIVVGQTNASEFGLLAVTEPELRGPTRNPWDLERTPGGSSGGSGAAVAAGFVPAGHGGDGGGSIRIPAAACGVFGLKPSRGRNPAGPHFSGTWLGLVQEHVISRTVRDSAAFLDVTGGPELGGPYSPPLPARPFLQEVGIDPGSLRIAFTTEPLMGNKMHPDCVAALEATVDLLEQLGHQVQEEAPPFDKKQMTMAYLRIVAAAVAADIDHAAELTGRQPTADQFEPITWLVSLVGRSTGADELAVILRGVQAETRRLAEFHERYDLILTPTLASPPVKIGELAPSATELRLIRALHRVPARRGLDLVLKKMASEQMDPVPNTQLFNLTGQPAMSVPLHWNADGLPIGLQFAARTGDEAILFRLAAQLEEARPWAERRPELTPA
jgi:amidase